MFQLFAVLFFLMMTVLGVGSGVASISTLNTLLLDAFPKVPIVYMSLFSCSVNFLIGLVYVTPVRIFKFDEFFLFDFTGEPDDNFEIPKY